MGGSNKTQSSSVNIPNIPGMNETLGAAKTVFDKGTAFSPNTTSMVSPFSTQQKAGLNGAFATATGARPMFQQNLNRVNEGLKGLGADGLTSLQDDQVNLLKPIAQGERLNGNPYVEDMIKRNADDMRYQTGVAASGMGRYGSGGHEGVLQKSVGDMAGGLRYQNYNTEANRQMDAIGSLFNAGQTGLGNIQGGTQALSGAYDASLDPFNTMMGVGQTYQNQNQAILNDNARIQQEKRTAQTAPIDWMANLGRVFGGSTVSTQTPNTPISSGIGGALSAFGATQNPLMALLGGAGGAFGGMF